MTTKKEMEELKAIKARDKANWALACSIIGFFIATIILEPIAICLANSSEALGGRNSKTDAAKIIAIISLIGMLLMVILSASR